MKQIKDYLALLGIESDDSTWIEGVTDRSNEVQQNWIFVCIQGNHHDGHEFIKEALSKSAYVIVENKKIKNTISVKDTRTAFAKLVNFHYDNPHHTLKMIGVTGTNGKSSVAHFIYQLLKLKKQKVLLIGTNGNYMNDTFIPSQNTTDSILILNRLFDEAINKDIEYVVMEVSSQAIAYHRVDGIEFDIAILTNLRQDHLDFHKTIEEYYLCKKQLFLSLKKNGVALLNAEESSSYDWYKDIKHPIYLYGIDGNPYSFKIQKLSLYESVFVWNNRIYHSSVLMDFNIYNMVAALSALDILGFKVKSLKKLKPIAGRMEWIITRPIGIMIDYAHTASALESVLSFLSLYKKGRCIIVFGCGGEREKEKRFDMGCIAMKYADTRIITLDNPRRESYLSIIQDIQQNTDHQEKIFVNRYLAIKYAIKIARRNDIIIITGKGNESTQTIYEYVFPFDDKKFVKEILLEEDLVCFHK